MGTFGGPGTAVGQFRFGAGGGNDAAAGGGLAVERRHRLRGRHRQRPRPAVRARRRPRHPDRAAGHARQPARHRGARHASGRRRRPEPSRRRVRHRRPAAEDGRLGPRRGPGPAELPLRRGLRPPGPPLRRRRPQPPRRALQHRRDRLRLQGALGLLRHRSPASSPTRAASRPTPGPRLRRQHRQRPHRRLRPQRHAAAVLRQLGPRAGPVQRPARRRRPTPAGMRAVTDSVNGRLELLEPRRVRRDRRGARRTPARRSFPTPSPSPSTAPGNAYVLDRRRGAHRRVRPRHAARRSARSAPAAGKLSSPPRWRSTRPGTISVADTGNDRIARFATGGDRPGRRRRASTRPAASPSRPTGQRIYVSDARNRITRLQPGRQRAQAVRRHRLEARQAQRAAPDHARPRRQPLGRRPRQQPRAAVRARRRAPRRRSACAAPATAQFIHPTARQRRAATAR